MVRKHIEMLYTGRCDIYEFVPSKKENGSVGYGKRPVLRNQPCRLSYTTRLSYSGLKSSSDDSILLNSPIQQIKLILRPDLTVKPGSVIVVTQNEKTQAYKNSGEPAIYKYHQEIVLERLEKWA